MKKLFKFLVAVFMGFALTSCSITIRSSLNKVELNKEAITLEVGQTTTLTATIKPEELASETTIVWSSLDEKVASVNDKGLVTALKEGTTKIKVTAIRGAVKREDTCTVKVVPSYIPVSGVTLNKQSGSLKVGESLTLVPTVLPDDATNKEIVWASSNESVAVVVDGIVTAISYGTSTITVTTVSESKSASFELSVYQPVTGVTLDKVANTIKVGESFTLKATVNPEIAQNKEVTWSTSNPHVASVNNGLVTAISSGNALITVTTKDGNYKAICYVTVVKPVTGVTLDSTSLDLIVNEETTLVATVSPSDATNKEVVWASSNSSIVKVDDGKVKALAPGNAVISVITLDGQMKATCNITVTQPAAGVSLNKEEVTIKVDEELTLLATVSPSNATNKDVTWASSNENVASVNNGLVTAHKAGTVTITVSTIDGSYEDICVIHVIQSVESVSLDKQAHSLNINDSFKLEASVLPNNATNKEVIWSSSNPYVASVNNGVVTALKAGTTTITVTTVDGNKTSSCVVTVVTPVAGVTLNKESHTLKINETVTLSATVSPSDATNKEVIWSSSNESVATVDNGLIKAVGKGQAVITVTTVDGSFEVNCIITVSQPVTGVTLDKEEVTIKVGDITVLHEEVLPSDATNKEVIWSSSNENVVTIKNGAVTALSKGEATVTVTTVDGSFKDTCKVIVLQSVAGVSLNKHTHTLNVNETVTLLATVSPSNASNKDVVWSSSNESVATVDNGIVKALSKGTATISVTTVDGLYKDTCVITVLQQVTGVTLDKEEINIRIGYEKVLLATVSPSDATNKEVVWSSSNEEVAFVNNGVITALSVGEVVITVTTVDGGYSASSLVKVVKDAVHAESITIEQADGINEIEIDETLKLTAVVTPSDTTDSVVWFSGNEFVATVDRTGLVTAHNEGVATIRAVINGYEDSYTVTVSKITPTITLNDLEVTYLDEYEVNPTSDCEEIIEVTYYTSINGEKGVKLDSKPLNAGEYIVVATIQETYKYNFVSKEVKLVINKKQLDMSNVAWSYEEEFVYNTQAREVALVNLPDEVKAKYENNVKTIVGDYKATFTLVYDEDNYELINNEITSLDWSIVKATIDLDDAAWNYSEPFTYNTSEYEVKLVDVKPLVSVSYDVNKATNAGSYTAVATLKYDEHNYKLANVPALTLDWEIRKAIVNRPDADNRVFTYNGSIQTYVLATNPGIYTISGDELTQTNAGTYTIIVSLDDVDNYIWDNETNANLTYTFVINRYKVTKPVANEGLVYNGELQTGVYDDSYYSFVEESETGSKINAGSYDVLIKLDDKANYMWADGTDDDIIVTYEIDKLEVEAPTVVGTYTYNTNKQTLVLDGYNEDIMDISGNKETNADDYTAVVTLDNNHKWANGFDGNIAWSIKKATIDLTNATWNYTNPFTYDGSTKVVEIEDDFLPSDVKITYVGNEQTNASGNVDYEATATLVYNSNNYEVKGSFDTLVWKINKAEVEAPTVVGTYTYNTNKQTLVLDGYNEDIMDISGNEATDADDYTAVVTLDNNHKWANGFDGIILWSIEQATIDMSQVAWDYNGAKVYNSQEHEIELVNVPSLITKVNYSGNKATNVGNTYKASVSFEYDSKNYVLSNRVEALDWEINPLEVEITWNYENSYTYNGLEQALPTATYKDLLGNDVVIVVKENDNKAFVNAVDYMFVASFDENYEHKSNYVIKNSSLELAINKVIAEAPKGLEAQYGQYLRDVQLPDVEIGIWNFNDADLDTKFEEVKDYTFTVTFTSTDPNYETNITDEVIVKVGKANNEITEIGNIKVTYGAGFIPVEFKADNDTGAVITFYKDETKLDGEPTEAGEYRVVIYIPESKTHKEAYKEVTLKIEPRKLTISYSETTFVYDAQDHQLEAEIANGKVVGDDIELEVTGPAKAVAVGEYAYTVTLTGEDKGNYDWEDVVKTVKINAPNESVRIETIDDTLDLNANYALAVEYNGKVYSIPNTMSLNGSTIKAGTYIIHEEEKLLFDLESESWSISKDSNGVYYIYSEAKYLGAAGSSQTNLNYSSSAKIGWVLATSTKGQYLQSNFGSSRGLLLNPNKNNGGIPIIGHYAASNINSDYAIVKLYKLPSTLDVEVTSNEGGKVTWSTPTELLTGLYSGIDTVSLSIEANETYYVKSVTYANETVFSATNEDTTELKLDIPVTKSGTINVTFARQTVEVSYVLNENYIVALKDSNNKPIENGTRVEIGTTITYVITAATGYELNSVNDNDIVNVDSYTDTITVNEDTVISATAVLKTYDVTPNIKDVDGNNSIAAVIKNLSSEREHGSDVTFTVNVLNEEYEVKDVYVVVNEETTELSLVDELYSFKLLGDTEIVVVVGLKPAQKYIIDTTNKNASVTILDEEESYEAGTDIQFKVAAAEGYYVTNVTLSNDEVELTADNGTYSFVMPEEDISIIVETALKLVITVKEGENIEIIITDTNGKEIKDLKVLPDTEIVVTVNAADGHEVDYVNGEDITNAESYTTRMTITKDTTISASAVAKEYNLETSIIDEENIDASEVAEIEILTEGRTHNTEISFKITLNDSDYEVKGVYINNTDESLEPNNDGKYSFTLVEKTKIIVVVGLEPIYIDGIAAKFEFGANGTGGAQVDGNDLGTSKSYEEDGYILALTSMSKVYGPAYDKKGNSAIKLGTSSVAGKFSFTVPAEISKVIIYVAGRGSKKVNISINNGEAILINTLSDNGEYTPIEINTTTNKTITLVTSKPSGGDIRCMINTIVFYKSENIAKTIKEVKDAIDAIGEVTLDSVGAIENAETLYNKLTPEQKAKVDEDLVSELTKAKEAYNKLKAKVDEVETAINNIGTVTLNSKQAIENAESLFNALSEELKAKVSTEAKEKLASAIDEYDELKAKDEADTNAANEVVTLINAIGTVTLGSEAAILEAEEALDSLTSAQLAKVSQDSLNKLTSARTTYEALVAEKEANDAAVKEVEDAIKAIGDVALEDKEAIEKAEALLEALDEELKAQVKDELKQALVKAREEYEELKANADADSLAVANVESLIANIGDVTLDNEAAIIEAEEAYNALSEELKANVDADLVKVLKDARDEYDELKAKDEADTKAANDVMTLINAIGEVTLENHVDKLTLINAAYNAYNTLDASLRSQVSNKGTLDAAKAEYDNLVEIQKVIDAIDAIGNIEDITTDSEESITEAETAYEELSQSLKVRFDNEYGEYAVKLESAREKLDSLLNSEPKWEKVELADIKPTDVVVIVWTKGSNSWAISNDKGTSVPTAVKVTINGDELIGEIADNIKWNISNNNGELTIYPNGITSKWLYCINDNKGLCVGTGDNKIFIINSNYLFNKGQKRYAGVYNSQDVRSYTSINSNISGQTLSFFRWSNGSSSGSGSEPVACEHTNTTTKTVDATCTEAGTKTITCVDCGETVSTETIAATGHNYDKGACTNCGVKDPNASTGSEPKEATLSFANKAQRTEYTTSKQVWEQNGIKLTNDKGSSTSNVADYANPARFYKSSKITITAPGNIKSIVFTCSSSSYVTDLKSSIKDGTVTVSGSTVTVTFADPQKKEFVISSLSGQVRMNSIKVTYLG